MNSLILCEGKTDCVLLQYYLEKVHSWKYKGRSGIKIENGCWSNCFTKEDNVLNIAETKGCSRLVEGLISAITRNENAAPGNNEDFLEKIIIFTDNDEEKTEADLISDIQIGLAMTSASFAQPIQKGVWNKGTLTAIEGIKNFELYIMFVPFSESGALETYLLNCVGNNDKYDKAIIDKGNLFVDNVDPEERYLHQRRLKTKAKFDVYFSVRTAANQFSERQDILKSVAWEKYDTIRTDFIIFSDLG